MLFNSLTFLIFFPIVLMVYFIIPRRTRYIWLLVTSYYFYMSWNVKYAFLLFGSTLVTYLAALLIDGFRDRTGLKRFMVFLSLVLNLGILFIFKYLDFFIDSMNKVLAGTGVSFRGQTFNLLLPMGISFYIFQAVGYTIDVYRGKISAEKNILKYALFVSFFPQLVAGPIERSTNLLPQLNNVHLIKLWDARRIQRGAVVMLYGYFMKMIIADRAAVLVDYVFDPARYGEFGGITYWVAAILFSIQIYCDFAGYTYIAIGAARIMGINLMHNFNVPYMADSIKDFWDRWHISLSSWFRDYLYFPLGGSKKGRFRKYINVMIVFLVSGLWHGAAWHYVIWGGLHGVMRVFGELTTRVRERIYAFLHVDQTTEAGRLGKMLVTFVLVTIAWIFFRAASVREAMHFVKSMFTRFNPWVLTDGSLMGLGLDGMEWNILVLSIIIMAVVDILRYKKYRLTELFMKQNLSFRWLFFYFGIISIVIFGVYGANYDAAQFIYFQF